jgi:hypothetical protein
MRSSIIYLFFFFFALGSHHTFGQYATREISKKKQDYTDSLKQVKYDYIFPILGQKVYSAGFDIPYPAGVMGNFIWMDQSIVIDNMQLGLETDNQDIPLTNVDEFIQFGENTNRSFGTNIRPDIWVLPFLNVYGLFGYGKSETTVQLTSPISMKSVVDQDISTTGFGVMGAFGLGPLWTSVDANWTWTKPELLDKAVLVKVLGVRVGKTFEFKSKPDRNVAFWVGGMRAKMGSSTVGQIQLIDALPAETWNRRDELVNQYDAWYDALPPLQKAAVDQTPLPDIVDRIEQADGESIIRYGMDKQVKQEWNVVFGAQFQFSKRWIYRTEWGLIGDRKSAMLSVNYRFLL